MAKIRIAGVIVSNNEKWIYDWLEIEAFCENMLREAIKNEHEELEITINSPGGCVFSGSDIYTTLKNHKGNVTVHIAGLAASAASMIAMAGDTVKASPTAQLMMHNVSSKAQGDYRDMEHRAEMLKSANNSVANAYMLKSGKNREEILQLMDDETWMTAEKAKEYGFVDEILFQNDIPENELLVASATSEMLPQAVINQMQKKRQQAELDLLKIKNLNV